MTKNISKRPFAYFVKIMSIQPEKSELAEKFKQENSKVNSESRKIKCMLLLFLESSLIVPLGTPLIINPTGAV